jgi:hypothetical protein
MFLICVSWGECFPYINEYAAFERFFQNIFKWPSNVAARGDWLVVRQFPVKKNWIARLTDIFAGEGCLFGEDGIVPFRRHRFFP